MQGRETKTRQVLQLKLGAGQLRRTVTAGNAREMDDGRSELKHRGVIILRETAPPQNPPGRRGRHALTPTPSVVASLGCISFSATKRSQFRTGITTGLTFRSVPGPACPRYAGVADKLGVGAPPRRPCPWASCCPGRGSRTRGAGPWAFCCAQPGRRTGSRFTTTGVPRGCFFGLPSQPPQGAQLASPWILAGFTWHSLLLQRPNLRPLKACRHSSANSRWAKFTKA
mmetsp:Transcript_85617/g.242808  ORF Transcript_85617/g.242808 Transcript_85617/m.242808 type:complete len:227 (-) Transcript_85617:488-1168(-)